MRESNNSAPSRIREGSYMVVGLCRSILIAHTTLVLVLSLAPSSTAQVVAASIVGQATDESHAVLPGVTVTVTSPALQVQSMTSVTDSQGEFRITPLPI